MRSFVEELGQERENAFLLINVIFKRIKQLSARVIPGQENAPTPELIAARVYQEIKEGKIKAVLKDHKARKECVEKMDFKEISLSEFPILSKGSKIKSRRGRSR